MKGESFLHDWRNKAVLVAVALFDDDIDSITQEPHTSVSTLIITPADYQYPDFVFPSIRISTCLTCLYNCHTKLKHMCLWMMLCYIHSW